MFVTPKTQKTKYSSRPKMKYSLATNFHHKDGVSTNKTILFGVIAFMVPALVHIQAMDSGMAKNGQFTASAFSEEELIQTSENRIRNHFSSDVSGIVYFSDSDYSLLEERGVVRKHFSADTSNVINSIVESISSSEHVAKRLHF